MSDEIRQCTEADQTGKVLYQTLDFPVAGGTSLYRIPLSDQVLLANLPDQELAQVCKDAGHQGFYLSATPLQTLRAKLNPENQGLDMPTGADRDLSAQIQWLMNNPPPQPWKRMSPTQINMW